MPELLSPLPGTWRNTDWLLGGFFFIMKQSIQKFLSSGIAEDWRYNQEKSHLQPPAALPIIRLPKSPEEASWTF